MGFKTGLYTSPHYVSYRERIKIDGEMISRSYVLAFVNRLIEAGVFKSDFKPSFFEISVAMAFSYFKDMQTDYAVIETGLGGRLDSTNVIDPEISLITNIGFDHMNFLGDTLEKIAFEKAGIIKAGKPVIIGKSQSETREIFADKAKEMKSPIKWADRLPRVELLEMIKGKFPAYQEENLYSAYYCVTELMGKPDDDLVKRALTEGLKSWGYIGRYMRMSTQPTVIYDSAHNLQGIEALMSQLRKEDYESLHIVLGVVEDKDLSRVLPLFPKDANYYFSAARIPRAMKSDILKAKAGDHDLKGRSYSSMKKALAAARRRANKKDMILVTGSIFTVADVLTPS